ncbi:ABC transporter permease [Microvirga sp. BT689]|uniref:ABC transporter permease n=1 Tax=Microvirga arvi TaxID=2778731 RepID=UPI0019512CE2|nr:ABC transporter permease [Microvirga arvi]MBM6581871.1 ABC transporter permease [Microvirga arvi]
MTLPFPVAAPLVTSDLTRSQRALRFIRRFARHTGASAGVAILLVLVVCTILAPFIAPFDPTETDVGARLSAPDSIHWLGVDLHGRDIFSRIVWGGRYSLAVGMATVLLALVVGSTIGIFLGYRGGRVDAIGSRAIDVLLGFPSVVMAILVVAVLGVGLVNVVIAVAIAQIPRFARVVRGAVLVVKEQLYIDAARAIGANGRHIMVRHLVPNVMPTLIVLGTLNLGDAILSTATLSFLGLGAQPPAPEWGAMLNDGRDYMRYAPWMMFFPGLALFLTVMSVNLIGDRLSHLLDPRARNK